MYLLLCICIFVSAYRFDNKCQTCVANVRHIEHSLESELKSESESESASEFESESESESERQGL